MIRIGKLAEQSTVIQRFYIIAKVLLNNIEYIVKSIILQVKIYDAAQISSDIITFHIDWTPIKVVDICISF